MKIALGLGCDRGTSEATLRRAVDEALAKAGATLADVAAVASITLKADEPGLLALCHAQGWTPVFHAPEALAAVPVPNPSETVRRYTGTPSVSEAAALLAAGPGAPMAALLVEKHKHLGTDGRNATVSVARVSVHSAADRQFTETERDIFHAVLAHRRDMRHFKPGAVVGAAVRARLLAAAHAAPSVGLMQPWRFIRITDPALRCAMADVVEAERQCTADALGERAAQFLALKVEGVRECAELWVAALAPDDGTVFGRRTLPREMAWCSMGCAIENLWLAARADNLGLGWVSMVDSAEIARIVAAPPGAEVLGLLCIGPVEAFYDTPMLEAVGWRKARSAAHSLHDNTWPAASPAFSAPPLLSPSLPPSPERITP